MGDLFNFPTGRGLDAYRWTISSARYDYDADYNKGESLCLILIGDATEPDGSLHEGYKELYPATGFEPVPGSDGARCIHEQDEGKDKTFQRNSNVAQLFIKAGEVGLDYVARFDGDPRWATPWVGLTFDMQAEVTNRTFNDRNTGEPVTRDVRRAWPVALVESGAAAVPSAPSAQASATASATAAPAAAPVAQAAGTNGSTGLSMADKIRLMKDAKESTDQMTWLEKVTNEGVDLNEAMQVWESAKK